MKSKLRSCLSAGGTRLISLKKLVKVAPLLLAASPGICNADPRFDEEGLRQHCAETYHRDSDYAKCVMRGLRSPQVNSFLDHDPAYKKQPFVGSQSSSTTD